MSDSYDYIVICGGAPRGGGGGGPIGGPPPLGPHPPTTVLWSESGPADKSMLIHMPRGHGKLFGPGNPHIWEYQVQTGGNGPTERWYRGRTLGGSSYVHGII